MSNRQKNVYMFLSISLLFLVTTMAYGHNPVIVKNHSSRENPVLIKKPEISYAYYGEFAGKPHYYKIVSSKPFNLYVNILVPDYSHKKPAIIRHDMSFQVFKDDVTIFTGEGMNSDWRRFFEDYARDHYYWGPEFNQDVDAGTYYIKVYNKNNNGKYSLATGKKEHFGILDIVKVIYKVIYLKMWFFRH